MMMTTRDQTKKKRKWKFTSALKKAEKETSQTCRFVCHYYSTCNHGSCRARCHRIYANKPGTGNGQRKKKTRKKIPNAPPQLELQQQQKHTLLRQEVDQCLETVAFMDRFCDNKEATPQERLTLIRASINVLGAYTDLYDIHGIEVDDRNASVIIQEHRSKVAKEINYVCNNVSNVAILKAYRRLLADFQTGPNHPKDPPSQIHHPHLQDQDCNLMSPLPICTPLGDEPKLIYDVIEQEIHHPHLQDQDGNLMSSKPDMTGEGSSKPLPIQSHDKCCRTPYWAKPEPIFKAVKWLGEEDGC